MSVNRLRNSASRISSSFAPTVPPFFGDKPNPKLEIFYMSLMCLVANFLSSITLEVGSRSQLGQTAIKSTGFPILYHRAYTILIWKISLYSFIDLRVKLLVSDLISGGIATILVVLGKKSHLPQLYVPWLLNTLRGMAFCEGPTLLRLAFMIMPNSDLPAKFFLFITFILYVEQLCLWHKILSSFRHSWTVYSEKKRYGTANYTRDENNNVSRRVTNQSISDNRKSKVRNLSSTSEFSFDKIRQKNNTRSTRSHFTNRTG